MKNENLKKHLNNKIILGLSWKYIYLLIILLGIGGLLVLVFVYKKDSRFEAIKIFISITSVAMTFIVFLRGFEVFEETQKGNAKDNVNKNFYTILGQFQKIQLKIKDTTKSNKNDHGNYFKSLTDKIEKFDGQPTAKDKCILTTLEENEEQLISYIAFLNQILSYINSKYRDGTIEEADYRMYIKILSAHFGTKEIKVILLYAFYSEQKIDLAINLLGTGLFYDDSERHLFELFDDTIEEFSDEYMIFIKKEKYSLFHKRLIEEAENKQEYFDNEVNEFVDFFEEVSMSLDN